MVPSIATGICYDMPLLSMLEYLHSVGWKVVELSSEHLCSIDRSDKPDQLIEATLKSISDLGMEIPQAHAKLVSDVAHPDKYYRDCDIATFLRQLKIASELGIKTLVIHPGTGGRSMDMQERQHVVDQNVDAFKRLGDCAGELGVRIGIENLWLDGAFGCSSSDLLGLLDSINHQAIGVIIDTSHANICTGDPAKMIRQLGSAVVGTHISDNNGITDDHRTPGFGNIDWPEVVQALRGVGYSGVFNLEIGQERHPIMEIRSLKLKHALKVVNWLLN